MNLDKCILESINYISSEKLTARFKVAIVCTIYDRRGKPISVGTNRYDKTHPRQAILSRKAHRKGLTENGEQIYLHAEMSALVKCRKEPYSMLVVRVDRNGNLSNCKPCPICQMAIEEAGIEFSNVYYTTGGSDCPVMSLEDL
jgi:tRNA(Arg) A34 adenosine deaminase TadA